MKTCVICTSDILDPMRKKTCSPECGDKLEFERAKIQAEKVRLGKQDVYVTCGCCGAWFLKRFRQVYCSDKCRVKISRQNFSKQYLKTKAKGLRKKEKVYTYEEQEVMRSGYY